MDQILITTILLSALGNCKMGNKPELSRVYYLFVCGAENWTQSLMLLGKGSTNWTTWYLFGALRSGLTLLLQLTLNIICIPSWPLNYDPPAFPMLESEIYCYNQLFFKKKKTIFKVSSQVRFEHLTTPCSCIQCGSIYTAAQVAKQYIPSQATRDNAIIYPKTALMNLSFIHYINIGSNAFDISYYARHLVTWEESN